MRHSNEVTLRKSLSSYVSSPVTFLGITWPPQLRIDRDDLLRRTTFCEAHFLRHAGRNMQEMVFKIFKKNFTKLQEHLRFNVGPCMWRR